MTHWRPIFALFEQSLRADLRSGWFAAARSILLGVVLFSLLPIQQLSYYGVFSAPGLQFFSTIAWTSIVGISLAAISYFAAVITEDKEERTLGLLRMTDLSPVAILLGKSTGRLVTSCLFIAMTIPFLILAVTLGGVGVRQIAAAYACLIAYLILAANIALLWSVVFARTATASALTLFTFFLLFGLPPLLGAIAGEIANTKYWLAPYCPAIVGITDCFVEFSPFVALFRILSAAYSGAILSAQVLSNLLVSAVFFALSWAVFDPCNRTETEVAPMRISLTPRRSKSRKIPAGVSGASAITWKDMSYVGGGAFGIAARVAGTAAIIGICLYVSHRFDVEGIQRELVGAFMIFVPLTVAGFNLVMDTERMFGEELKWKTLSTLMSLPYTPEQIARTKLMYPLRTTLPILAFVPVGMAIVPHETGEALESIFRYWQTVAGTLLFILACVLFLYLTAFLSIHVKRGAALLAMLLISLGWGAYGMFMMVLTFTMMGDFHESFFFFPAYAIVITLIMVIHFAIPPALISKAAAEQ